MVEENDGFEGRYNTWIFQVDIWADQYGITREQAIAILFDDHPWNKKITYKELLSWAECADFYFKFKGAKDGKNIKN